jgi:potassium/hydrogen antiporter
MIESRTTAVALLVAGLVLGACVLASRLSARSGVPVFLLFVVLGMALGDEGLGRIPFEDYALAFRLGSVALALILFDAGLKTPVTTFRRYIGPALLLATIGVFLTAVIVACAAHWAGFSWLEALLIGSIVSSTDSAAVFSVLRMGGVEVHERVGATLEIESGLNDPMAILLTVALAQAVARGVAPSWTVSLGVAAELAIGAAAGLAAGAVARAGLRRLELPAAGLYPLLTIAFALATFGAATVVHGSGFLAVYVAGIVIGEAKLPYKPLLARVHDFTAWLGQVVMFVVLGLLAFPSRLASAATPGIAVALVLAFVARPLVVAACLVPLRYRAREIVFVAWVGLKGAVPIVLACTPVLLEVPGARRIFDVVFFAVVLSALLQGSTVRWLTRRLRLGRETARTEVPVLEITATRPLGHELLVFEVHRASAVCDVDVADIPFPEDSAAMLLVRGDQLLAPRGATTLAEGDVVYVFCRADDRATLELLFGGRVEA